MNILLGISGGIAAYKMPQFVRLCLKNNHKVDILLTPSAARFVSPLTLEVLSGNKVWTEDFDRNDYLAHINLADNADVFVLAPATANTIAKLATGIADNLLSSTALALTCRKIIFPTMNVHMYENPVTQANIKRLETLGWEVIAPDNGALACGYEGKGRLPDEDFILAQIERKPNGPLKGQKILVTAGATVEAIDPIRFLSNRSSGHMGLELALAAFRLGADVTFIHGKVSVPVPAYLHSQAVESTSDMLSVISEEITDAQALIMAAAPSDFRPVQRADQKIKKSKQTLTIEFVQNPDILKSLLPLKGKCRIIGFALETQNARKNAEHKLVSKGMDWVVLNNVSKDFHPMGNNFNKITLIGKNKEYSFEGSKSEVATKIINHTLLSLS